jgi:hypothetical protein
MVRLPLTFAGSRACGTSFFGWQTPAEQRGTPQLREA